MSNIKSNIAKAVKIFGIMALIAAFAATAFPTRSFASPEANTGKLIVNVYSPIGGTGRLAPLSNASIDVLNADGIAVAGITTNASGSVSVELPKGIYKVIVSAAGYTTASGEAVVDAGRSTTVKFNLARSSQAAFYSR